MFKILNFENLTLKSIADSGIIDIATIQDKVIAMQRKELLISHAYKMWQGKDGKWRTYVTNEDGERRLIVRKNQADLENYVINFEELRRDEPTVKECFDKWSKSKLEYGEIQKQTYDRYAADFKRYFNEFGKIKIKYISEMDLENFVKTTIHNYGLKAKGYGNLRIVLMGTFIWAKKHKYTQLSIVGFLKELQLSNKIFKHETVKDETQVFTSAEEEAILTYISDNGYKPTDCGVALAFMTGLRVGEMSALKKSDVNGNILNVDKTEVKYIGENGKRVCEVRQDTKGAIGFREVVLTENAKKLLELIREGCPNGEYLFTDKHGKRIEAKHFSYEIRHICKEVGINPRSFHKIRKTYATKLLNSGIEEKVIQKQMGHTDILTTKRFYYFNNQQIDDIKNKLDAI